MREVVVPTFVFIDQPIPEVLAQLVAAGVRLVEVHGDAPDTHIDLTDEAAVSSLVDAIGGVPLEVHSVHSPLPRYDDGAWDISQPDGRKRAAALGELAKVIASSARLGARHVIVHLGGEGSRDERLAHSRTSLAQLARVAQGVGVRIVAENLPPNNVGGCLAEIKRVLEGVDPGIVGFCLDTGHAMLGADSPSDYVRALGGRLEAIHWHANDGEDDAHLFPGVGQTEWADLFAALDEVGYDLPVTVEAVPPEGKSLRQAVEAARVALQANAAPRLP